MPLIHHDQIWDWLNKTGEFSESEPESEPEPENFLCPKSDRCVMDCYHKKPHAYEEKFCNDLDGKCGTKCVHELWSDITFFEEDFNV